MILSILTLSLPPNLHQGVARGQGPHRGLPGAVPRLGSQPPVVAVQLQLLLRALHGADGRRLLPQGETARTRMGIVPEVDIFFFFCQEC